MKEIFDWLREQMLIRKSAWEEDSVADKVSAEKHIGTWNVALRILEKAEAKWKEDCCEWKPFTTHPTTSWKNCEFVEDITNTWRFKFCPYCGKPIKIVEVE